MSSKFFNNNSGNTLFDKLKGIACNMANFDRFLAVVGFFRSSGYFKLRKELNDVEEIKILVGINIDDIFRRHNKAMLMLEKCSLCSRCGRRYLADVPGPCRWQTPDEDSCDKEPSCKVLSLPSAKSQ